MLENTVTICVLHGDGELDAFLLANGVSVRPSYGMFNGPMPPLAEILDKPAPYIWATAASAVLISAIQAYAKARHRRVKIQRTQTGMIIDATNYSATELKDLGVGDLVRFEIAEKTTKDS